MLKLLLKELKLNVKFPLYLFTLLAAMMLIPSYPIIVGAGYTIMQVFVYLQLCAANKSMEFTAVLPVKRRDIVASTTVVVVFFQALFTAVSLLLLPVAKLLHGADGNIVGIDGNFTYVAMALVCFGLFNLAFLPKFFSTGYKYGCALLLGIVCFVVGYLVMETIVQAVPTVKAIFDGYNEQYLWARAAAAVVALGAYVGLTVAANNIAVKKFEKVNL